MQIRLVFYESDRGSGLSGPILKIAILKPFVAKYVFKSRSKLRSISISIFKRNFSQNASQNGSKIAPKSIKNHVKKHINFNIDFYRFWSDLEASSLPEPDKERTESMLESMLLSVIVVRAMPSQRCQFLALCMSCDHDAADY